MPNPNIDFTIREVEKHGDTMMYSMDPFTISGDIVNKLKNKIMTDEDIDVEVTEVGCVDNDTVYNIVEQMPEFPGKEKAMMEFVTHNIHYPEEAKEKGIEGRVFVGFVVEKDGSINEVKVLKGIGHGCDEEAVRVVKSMPKWKPGMQKGKPVRVHYQMPFFFKLSDNQPKQPVKKSSVSKVDMKPDKNGVYQIVEEMPQYTGGEAAMMDFVAKNIVYPQEARDKEISGRVFVSFIVEKDGSVNEVNVKKGIGGGCDEEAVRVVKAMPKWKPGKMKGEAVRVS
jgi:TonB family protein